LKGAGCAETTRGRVASQRNIAQTRPIRIRGGRCYRRSPVESKLSCATIPALPTLPNRLMRMRVASAVSASLILLSVIAVRAQSAPPDYSEEAFVIEQSKSTFRFEKDGTGRRDASMRVKVQSAAG